MKVLVDTNVFIASLTDEPDRGDTATAFLNQSHEFSTAILNLMELRSVLAKKKQLEQDEVEEVLTDITERADVYAPDLGDFLTAYEKQRETLLYTMDCVLLALAEDVGAEFVTFDRELLEHGATEPSALL